MENKNPINIRCHHCLKDNAINLSKNIQCRHCGKSLTNEKYIRPIISTVSVLTTAAIIGLGSGVGLNEYFFTDNRYPVSVEYSIIESCLSADEEPLAIPIFRIKKVVCQCALTETQKKFDYQKYEDDRINFLEEYKSQARHIVKIIIEEKNREKTAK